MSPLHPMSCVCCGDLLQGAFSRRRFLATAAALAAAPAFAQAQSVPSIAYDSIPDPVRLPADMYFGDCGGCGFDTLSSRSELIRFSALG